MQRGGNQPERHGPERAGHEPGNSEGGNERHDRGADAPRLPRLSDGNRAHRGARDRLVRLSWVVMAETRLPADRRDHWVDVGRCIIAQHGAVIPASGPLCRAVVVLPVAGFGSFVRHALPLSLPIAHRRTVDSSGTGRIPSHAELSGSVRPLGLPGQRQGSPGDSQDHPDEESTKRVGDEGDER